MNASLTTDTAAALAAALAALKIADRNRAIAGQKSTGYRPALDAYAAAYATYAAARDAHAAAAA
jgi:hypothetical protein